MERATVVPLTSRIFNMKRVTKKQALTTRIPDLIWLFLHSFNLLKTPLHIFPHKTAQIGQETTVETTGEPVFK